MHAHPWQFSIDKSICSFSFHQKHIHKVCTKGCHLSGFRDALNFIRVEMELSCVCVRVGLYVHIYFVFLLSLPLQFDLNKIWTIHIMLFTCYNDAVFSLYQWNLITAQNEREKKELYSLLLSCMELFTESIPSIYCGSAPYAHAPHFLLYFFNTFMDEFYSITTTYMLSSNWVFMSILFLFCSFKMINFFCWMALQSLKFLAKMGFGHLSFLHIYNIYK